jgi:FMN phosphatase YigB (HAD superfamily)
MNELENRDTPLHQRPISLMPGLPHVLSLINLEMGIWANTRRVREAGVRLWLKRAGIDAYFRWAITSVDAKARKPEALFFPMR